MKASEAQKKILKDFGSHLKKLREKQGLRVTHVTRKSNIEPANLRRIERGEANITLITMLRICYALDLDIRDLVSFKKDQELLKDIID